VQIDEEIRRFIDAAYEDASKLIEANGETLEAIAAALLEHEVLDGEEIYEILGTYSDVDVEAIKRQKEKAELEVAESTSPEDQSENSELGIRNSE
jgi:cell division protease FtsH